MGGAPLQQDGNHSRVTAPLSRQKRSYFDRSSGALGLISSSSDLILPKPIFASKFSNEICRLPPSSPAAWTLPGFPTQSISSRVPRVHPAYSAARLEAAEKLAAWLSTKVCRKAVWPAFKKLPLLKQAGGSG